MPKIKNNRRFRSLFLGIVFLFILLVVGPVGYIVIEEFSYTEAFYMTVITIFTVGYGEVHPLSQGGMFFTTFLIIFSFGIFGYVITTFTRFVVDGGFKNLFIERRVNSKISKLSGHVIVCGFGRNGKQAASELNRHNEQVLVIEKFEEIIEKIKEFPDLMFIKGNAIHDEKLQEAKISKAKALITTLPDDANNLMVVLTARQMNPDLIIISRASNNHSDIKLRRAGATNVIMPDIVGGAKMAKLVAQPDVVEFIEKIMLMSGDSVRLVEILARNLDACYIDHSIEELKIRKLSGANIVGLKNASGEYIFNPSPEINISCDDKLFVLGTPVQINKMKEVLVQSKT